MEILSETWDGKHLRYWAVLFQYANGLVSMGNNVYNMSVRRVALLDAAMMVCEWVDVRVVSSSRYTVAGWLGAPLMTKPRFTGNGVKSVIWRGNVTVKLQGKKFVFQSGSSGLSCNSVDLCELFSKDIYLGLVAYSGEGIYRLDFLLVKYFDVDRYLTVWLDALAGAVVCCRFWDGPLQEFSLDKDSAGRWDIVKIKMSRGALLGDNRLY